MTSWWKSTLVKSRLLTPPQRKDVLVDTLNLKVNDETKAEVLGIADFPKPDEATVVTMTVAQLDAAAGTVKVKVDVKRGSATDSKEVNVTGFKKPDAPSDDQKAVDEYLAGIQTSYTTSKTTTAASASGISTSTTWNTIAEANTALGTTIPTTLPEGITVTFKVTAVETPTGAQGSVKFDLTATKGSTSKAKSVTVTGWAAEA
ncbi:lipoprotein 17-related variable surface protein [Mycoplasma sp. ATU-Cv-508]|uniref:lipoprotein 17-related variable surface protein n=1 Tax=Mycoplasma sp. ATU-Cv-508 TaxID=2048001 RepID=UPI000FDEE257